MATRSPINTSALDDDVSGEQTNSTVAVSLSGVSLRKSASKTNTHESRFDKPNKLDHHPYSTVRTQDIREKNCYWLLHTTCMVIFFPLAVLRALLIALIMFFGYIILRIITIDIDFKKERHPKENIFGPKRSRLVCWLIQILHRITWAVAGVYWVTVRGVKNLDKAARFYTIAPHATIFDPIFVSSLREYNTGICVAAEKKRFITGFLFQCFNPIFVDPLNHESRKAAIEATLYRANAPEWQGVKQIFFVEGTTHRGSTLQTFQLGAFKPGVPVQPIVIEIPCWIEVLRSKITGTNIITSVRGAGWAAWSWDCNQLMVVLYILCSPWQPYHVTILPAYYPNQAEKECPRLFANNVREVMKTAQRSDEFRAVPYTRMEGIILQHLQKDHQKAFEKSTEYFIDSAELLEQFGSENFNKRFVLLCLDEFATRNADASTGNTFKDFLVEKLNERCT